MFLKPTRSGGHTYLQLVESFRNESASGGQELGKEDELAVWRCSRTGVPAHVHAPAQRVHRLELFGLAATLDQGPLSLAS